MYISKLLIQNIYSIAEVDITFEFHENGNPKPLIIVGENGSGKTTVLSTVVDAMYEIINLKYSNEFALHKDHESRAYWRVVGAGSQKIGTNYYLSVISFKHNESSISLFHKSGEVDWSHAKAIYIDIAEQIISSTEPKGVIGGSEEVSESFTKDQVSLFFPAFRFEYPGWVNPRYEADDSRISVDFRKARSELFSSISSKKNNDWVRNIIDDSIPSFHWLTSKPIFPDDLPIIHQNILVPSSIIDKRALNLIFAFNDDLSLILNDQARLFRTKGSSVVALMYRNTFKSTDITHLSSGESSIINMYLSICRNYYQDKSNDVLPRDLPGIVVIDEIGM